VVFADMCSQVVLMCEGLAAVGAAVLEATSMLGKVGLHVVVHVERHLTLRALVRLLSWGDMCAIYRHGCYL